MFASIFNFGTVLENQKPVIYFGHLSTSFAYCSTQSYLNRNLVTGKLLQMTNNIKLCEVDILGTFHTKDVIQSHAVWPDKNGQMSIKVAQKWIH